MSVVRNQGPREDRDGSGLVAGPVIRRLCVIGVGLIGGSLVQALRLAAHTVKPVSSGPAAHPDKAIREDQTAGPDQAVTIGEVVGCGRGLENLKRALELGVIDRYETDPARAVAGADMVLLAVPLGAMEGVMQAIAPALSAQAVVTDAGSAKGSVVAAARAALGPHLERFVPGHPIAGTEKSGVEASFPDLYRGRRVILTPLEGGRRDAVERVAAMWRTAGASVCEMPVEHHDDVLAATSHLPHVLAYGLVDTLSRWSDREEIFAYAAGGFRDFTRIASSDPAMWRDICLANSDAVVAALERYTADLEKLTEAVRRRDGEQLQAVFTNAHAARERFLTMLEG